VFPLLERVKFLAIFSSNLDEFFMVRVARLKRQIAAEDHTLAVDATRQSERLANKETDGRGRWLEA
jgi:polyphosphate kinase